MNILSWGIIGVGAVCEKKGGPPLYQVEGSRLIAVTRRTREKGEDWVRRHGHGRYVSSAEELLSIKEINAVYVSTRDDLHEEYTIMAAKAGKNVLVEKAMATNVMGCDRMIEVCKDAGVWLGVAYYRRCFPVILRIKQLIDAGALGKIKSIRMNDVWPLSHRIDMAHFLVGLFDKIRIIPNEKPDEIWNLGQREMIWYTPDGVEGRTDPGWEIKPLKMPAARINRHNESIRVEGDRASVMLLDLQGKGLTSPCELEIHRDGKVTVETIPSLRTTHSGLVENAVLHQRDKVPLVCDGVMGRRSQVILDIVNSLKIEDGEVNVDYSTQSSKVEK